MEGPRAVKVNELQNAIDLINDIFRIKNNCMPTMEKEFPLLLCGDNIDNMRAIAEDGRIVSLVNYYPSKILIEGCAVQAGSVGAVCTHTDYRGKNYASMILDDVEERLYADGADIMFVSGGRSLYTRRGCVKAGGFCSVKMTPRHNDYNGIELLEYEDKYLCNMVHAYNSDSTRFYRTNYEYENMLKGSTINWGKHSYRIFVIEHFGNIEGYIILDILNDNGLHGSIVEYAGNRELICKSMLKVIGICGLSDLSLVFSLHDPIINSLKGMEWHIEDANQQGTVKIINFVSFMNKLKPYFAQYLPDKILETVSFEQLGSTYIIKAGGQEISIEGINGISQLIFGPAAGEDRLADIFEEIEDKPCIKQFIECVFPIPIPWTGNINYI